MLNASRQRMLERLRRTIVIPDLRRGFLGLLAFQVNQRQLRAAADKIRVNLHAPKGDCGLTFP